MRTAVTLLHYTQLQSQLKTSEATFSPPVTIQRLPWHSPVVYVFGGLAAILGLITFALLVLACSNFKTSDQANADEESGTPEKGESNSTTKASPVFDQKFLVIMAGQITPTFLATPMSIRGASSFNRQLIYEKDSIKENVPATEGNREGHAESQGSQEQSQ